MTVLADPPTPATESIPAAKPAAPAFAERFRWLGTVATAIYAVAAWVYFLTFPHGLPLPYLDQSWSAIVTLASAEHWAFGRRIMLNYGPWSHLGIAFYYGPLFAANYGFQIISKVVLVALICRAGRALPPVGRALFFLANLGVGILEWETIHLLAVVYAGWLCAEDRTRAGRIVGGAGVVLAAAAALMKTFFLVFGVGVFGCVLARWVLRERGRRAAWLAGMGPLVGFLLCFGVDWKIAGQSLADLPLYLRGAMSLTDGHSRAMGLAVDAPIFLFSLAMPVVIGAIGAVLLMRGERGRRVAAWPLAAIFAGGLFMAWKQGFARPDAYHVSQYLWFVAVSAAMLPLFFDRRALSTAWYYAAVAGVWATAVWTMSLARPQSGPSLLYQLHTRPARNLQILFHPDAECARLDARLAQLRADCAMPRTRAVVGRASIDLFGTAQSILLDNGLNYAPTPTLQGFLAYTPYLAGLNAQTYLPGRAPEYVLYQGGSIDDRWPALDGAWQLREILWNYQPRLVEAGLILLQRKPESACTPLRPVLQRHGEFSLDARLDLSADGADWCELEVHRTLIGRLINFLYHEPALTMETTLDNGRRALFSVPPVMAQSGFLLRSGPKSREDAAYFLSGKPMPHPVKSIRLVGDALQRWAFAPEVTYRFYRLEPPPQG